MTLETDRLILRPWEDDDAADLYKYASYYYYVDANETCWHGLHELVSAVDSVVSHAAGDGYPYMEEE